MDWFPQDVPAEVGLDAGVAINDIATDVPAEVDLLGGEVVNEVKSLNAPKGTLSTEVNAAFTVTSTAATAVSAASPASTDWPSYNRTLAGDRYSPLAEITTGNVGEMKVICTYDSGSSAPTSSGSSRRARERRGRAGSGGRPCPRARPRP
jgi:glucose dehydrogenase